MSTLYFLATHSSETANTSFPGTRGSFLELLGIIAIFIIVLVLCWATTKFVATRSIRQKNTGNFEVIETYAIAKDRYLQLVRIGEKYFAIAVSKDNISMLVEIPEIEIIKDRQTPNTSVKGFSNVFQSVLDKMRKGDSHEPSDHGSAE